MGAAVRRMHRSAGAPLWPASPPPPPAAAAASAGPSSGPSPSADPPPWSLYRSELHRQRLPAALVPWAGAEGRARFRGALAARPAGAACFLPLAAHFDAQTEPATCGLGSAVMVLNALGLRQPPQPQPGTLAGSAGAAGAAWTERALASLPASGGWRARPWSDVLQCGTDVDEICALLRAAGATRTRLEHARDDVPAHAYGGGAAGAGLAAFREAVADAAARPAGRFLLMSFSRAALRQTGDGHFSPLGGYHAASDSLLVLDAAKFKYPPYWCGVRDMWAAMQATDWVTGRPRGYLVVEA